MHADSSEWLEKEVAGLKEGLRRFGRAWGKIHRQVGGRKTATQCKQFYDDFCHDKTLKLQEALLEHVTLKVFGSGASDHSCCMCVCVYITYLFAFTAHTLIHAYTHTHTLFVSSTCVLCFYLFYFGLWPTLWDKPTHNSSLTVPGSVFIPFKKIIVSLPSFLRRMLKRQREKDAYASCQFLMVLVSARNQSKCSSFSQKRKRKRRRRRKNEKQKTVRALKVPVKVRPALLTREVRAR